MKHWLSKLRVVCEIAFGHLVASRYKTLIVGSVGACAACLIVVGSAVLDSVDAAMRQGITESVAGDVQVYSAAAKGDFEIMGDAFVDSPEIPPLDDFVAVKKALLAVPNVVDAVPMGFSNGTISSSSAIDRALGALRDSAARRGLGSSDAAYSADKVRVRQIVRVMSDEQRGFEQITSGADDPRARQDLVRAASDQFWTHFEADPAGNLEFLETRVASQAVGAESVSLRYFGTDPAAFAKAFVRMRVVDGQMIPPGERGFLFSKRVYEEQIKLKAAHALDRIERAKRTQQASIAGNPELERLVAENVAGVSEILLQLDEDTERFFRRELSGLLGSKEEQVSRLLEEFFAVDDANFDARFTFFYRVLAPRLSLYRHRVGDWLTVQTADRNGYVRSANVRVYGTFAFDGLEQSPQAGSVNMMDLVTFRELYGLASPELQQELAAIRAELGVKDVERQNAEAVFFGSKDASAEGNDEVHRTVQPDPLRSLAGTRTRAALNERAKYDPRLVQTGPVLNVAVKLADADAVVSTLAAIEAAGVKAGLPLRAVSGEESSGLLGQFVGLMRGILLAAVLIIFVVTLIVVNNALMMATMDRIPEIGTLRAIGARRRFVFALMAAESMILGLIAGGLGAATGKLVLALLGRTGIPAWNDVMNVLFSGARLFPAGTPGQILVALTTVTFVSVVSGLYPAWMAMRVTPRQAMGAEA